MLLASHVGDDDEAVAQLKSGGDGAFEAMLNAGLDQEAVDNQLDAVILCACRERWVHPGS